ncbi:response regulator [Alkalisalibacterium limincola]|uniref:response regulator n=1 Tax=Alkalisalibacterium limincola TaxID=2699169 RepID=UPI0021082278|nr:response regulator transcription factor [Alkalisalibacterium limincola]
MSTPLRIALVDDQALVRHGLSALLGGLGLDIALECADGQALLDALDATPVDVVVSDVRMPGMDGITMTRALRDRGSHTPVILLTTFDDADTPLRAAQAGAQGFLLKDASPEDLRDAIEQAAAGAGWLQPVSTDPVRERFAYRDQAPPQETFGEREIAVLRLMAGGYSNREIAASLFLAEGTVKNYVSEILAKLDTRDRTRAVLKAITLRII